MSDQPTTLRPPEAAGLYDPRDEHDACGVGFVVDIKGRRSHGVVEKGLDIMGLFYSNLTLRGGPAPVRAYMPALMEDVLAGTLDPSPVFDMTVLSSNGVTPPVFHPLALALIAITAALAWRRVAAGKG